MLVKVYYIVNENNSLNFKNFKIDDDGNDFITFEFIECDLEDGKEKGGSIGKHKHKFKVEYKKEDKTFIIEKEESNENENNKSILIYTNVENKEINENFCIDFFSEFIKYLITKQNEENYKEYFQYLFDNYNDLLKKYIEELCSDHDDSINSFAMDLLSKFDHNLKETIEKNAENYTTKNPDNSNKENGEKNNHKYK